MRGEISWHLHLFYDMGKTPCHKNHGHESRDVVSVLNVSVSTRSRDVFSDVSVSQGNVSFASLLGSHEAAINSRKTKSMPTLFLVIRKKLHIALTHLILCTSALLISKRMSVVSNVHENTALGSPNVSFCRCPLSLYSTSIHWECCSHYQFHYLRCAAHLQLHS